MQAHLPGQPQPAHRAPQFPLQRPFPDDVQFRLEAGRLPPRGEGFHQPQMPFPGDEAAHRDKANAFPMGLLPGSQGEDRFVHQIGNHPGLGANPMGLQSALESPANHEDGFGIRQTRFQFLLQSFRNFLGKEARIVERDDVGEFPGLADGSGHLGGGVPMCMEQVGAGVGAEVAFE